MVAGGLFGSDHSDDDEDGLSVERCELDAAGTEEHGRSAADVFHAIADPNRRRLLDLLRDEEKPVQALAAGFDMSLAAVSQHLQILHAVGLVARRADGRRRLYRAVPGGLREVYEWTARYRAFWEHRLDKLERYLDRKDEA